MHLYSNTSLQLNIRDSVSFVDYLLYSVLLKLFSFCCDLQAH